jgi:hypothetical protein
MLTTARKFKMFEQDLESRQDEIDKIRKKDNAKTIER